MSTDLEWMAEAILEARAAAAAGEIPIGAVIVCRGEIIARGRNRKEERRDPTAHAEIEAIRAAAPLFPSWRLEECELFVTLEPCPMCAGAIVQARIDRVVYGCSDRKAGAAESLFRLLDDSRLNHRCQITSGVLADESRALLREFFQAQRKLGKK